MMIESTNKSTKISPVRSRQIVGISLPPALAREFKAHAGQSGLSLRKLFEEMWQTYKKQAPEAKR